MSSYIRYLESTARLLAKPAVMDIQYFVWTVNETQSNETMTELVIVSKHLDSGLLVLEPKFDDYILPKLNDQTGHRNLRLLVVKCNKASNDNATLVVGMVQEMEEDDERVRDANGTRHNRSGLYEVAVPAADTSGLRVFFNAAQHTLGRIELDIASAGTLPSWHIRFMKHIGHAHESTTLSETRDSMTALLNDKDTGLDVQAESIATRAPPIATNDTGHSESGWNRAYGEHAIASGGGRSFTSSISACVIS